MDKLLVVVAAAGLIIAIGWWFFGPKNNQATAAEQGSDDQAATIIVDGGYKPAIVALQVGKPAHITFVRKDPSSCLEAIIMPDFGISETLQINKPLTVTFTPKKIGEFTYTCGMRMFSAKIQVS
ncbi:cupredoxin domain-containing protein [Polaromonas sp.]|nr:cupredoxin domain-containing protein [Candidatus Saccharibacteria bacterium]